MNTPSEPPPGTDSWLDREAVIDRFEQAWQSSGDARIEEFLPPRGDGAADRQALLCELVKVDLEYRWERGQRVRVEEYLARFPELVEAGGRVLSDLIAEEMQVRQRLGLAATAQELAGRFPGQALPPLPGAAPQADSTSGTIRQPSATAPPGQARPGRLGSYEVREEIGRGAFATVYRGWDPELRREVAIKVPHPGLLEDPGAQARLLREASSAARLRHPAIVPIHEVSQERGAVFVVYQLVAGPTLAQVLRQTSPAPRQAAEWLASLAEALDYAHAQGIIHRDLKPGNILMEEGSRPMVADFGLALQTDASARLTEHGDILGTPAYMSPEQAAGKSRAVDARSDVYSLGVILYEMLCGRLPFEGNAVTVLHRVIHEEPARPRQLRGGLPRDLETICLKAMAKEPAGRYPTAGGLAGDLRRYLEHRPIRARRVGAAGRLARWGRRNPALAGTLVAAVLAIGIVSGLSFRQVVQERDRFRGQRDAAEANLYRALVSDARAQMRARDTGWWWKVLDNLRDAARLDVRDRDPVALRELAIQCMGSGAPCFRLHATWASHEGRVNGLAFSPDGRLLASAADRTIHLREPTSGRGRAFPSGHAGTITALAFHPGGRLLISGSLDGTVRVWEVEGTEAPPSPRVVQPNVGPIQALAVSPDGLWIAVGGKEKAIRLLAATGKFLANGSGKVLQGHSDGVNCLAFLEDSQKLVSGGRDRTLRLWDVASGQLAVTWDVESAPRIVGQLPRHPVLLWADRERFGFSTQHLKAKESSPPPGLHTDALSGLTFVCPPGFLILPVTASGDGTIKAWSDHRTPQEVAIARGEFREVASLAASSDGRWVAAGHGDGQVRLWELAFSPYFSYLWKQHSAVFIGGERRLAGGRDVADFSAGLPPKVTPYGLDAVSAMAAHPRGGRLAMGQGSGRLRLWNTAARRELRGWAGHDQGVTCLASDPAGRRLASGSRDGRVKLWDWASGRLDRSLAPGIGAVHQVAWGRDGRSLAAAGERGARLWHLEKESAAVVLHDRSMPTGVLAAGLDLVATADTRGAVHLHDPGSGKVLRTLRGHAAAVVALTFAPDGGRLVSAGVDGTIRLWNPATGDPLKVLDLADIQSQPNARAIPSWLAFHPGGRYLLSGGPSPLGQSGVTPTFLWDLDEGVAIAILGTENCSGCFLSDGSAALGNHWGAVWPTPLAELLAARQARPGKDRGVARRGVVTVNPGQALLHGGHTFDPWGVAASPDGRWVATAGHEHTVKLWDARTMKQVRTLQGHTGLAWCVAFSPDSKHLASGSGEVILWEVASGREVHRFEGHQRLVVSLAFHPTRPWLFSSSHDGTVRIWNHSTGRAEGVLHSFGQSVHGLAFRPDGRRLAAACHDHRVAVWDFSDPAPAGKARPPDRFLTGHASAVWSVNFSADGRYLASGADQGVIILWDGDTFSRVVALEGETGQIRCISFSRDGGLLAATAYRRHRVVWDLERIRGRLREMNLDW